MSDGWMSSKNVAAFLNLHRDNDVKVKYGRSLIPIADVHYHPHADSIVIDLVDGEDLKTEQAGWLELLVLTRFQIDAVFTGDLYIALECRHCEFIVEFPAPYDLSELVIAANDHADGCR